MPYHPMRDEELWAFLAAEPAHTGKLATTRPDGSPHVVPVWYAVDDGSVVFMTGADSVKGRNLRRDPRAAICVDDERPPFSFALLEGRVEVTEDLAELRKWGAVIGGRYMGADQAEAFGTRNAVPGELLVRLRPAKITSAADMTG
jgi:PPOX class probable F420-dependent enzyme